MTSSRNRLPTEVLLILFQLVDLPTLQQCQKVCKKWRQPAQMVIYKHIRFCTKRQFQNFLHCKEPDLDLWKLVKTIDFVGDMMKFSVNRKNLILLAKLCPNVERILGDNPPSDFWKDCYFISLKYWNHLTQIPNISNGPNEDYTTLAIACRNSLENVHLFQIFKQNNLKWIQSTVALLKTFKALKDLKLTLYSYGCAPHTFDDVLNQCSKLNKLNLTYLGIHRKLQNGRHFEAEQVNWKRVTPAKAVAKLELLNVRMNSYTIHYLKHKFPHLNHLLLIPGKLPVELEYTKEEMVQIIQYAMGLPSCLLHLVSQNDIQLLGSFCDIIKTPTVALNIIYTERVIVPLGTVKPYQMSFNKSDGKKKPVHNSSGKIELPQLAYDTVTHTQSYTPISTETAVATVNCQRYPDTTQLPPHYRILSSIGNQLSFLFVDLQRYDNSTGEATTSFRIDVIFQYCHSLKTLAFSSPHLSECSETCYINTSIQILAIFGTEIADDIFPQLSVRLPSLKHLQLVGCHIYDMKNDTNKEINVNMPYSSFESVYVCDKHFSAVKHPNPEVVHIDQFSRLYIMKRNSYFKLSTLEGEKYFKVKGSKVELISLAKYRGIGNEFTKFHVRCKSAKSLSIVKGGLHILNYQPSNHDVYNQ